MRVRSIAIVDIETSGMNPLVDEIIYVHCTILPASGRMTTISEYAKPSRPLFVSVEKLTGITNEMLLDKRPSSIVKSSFVDHIQDCIIIGRNKEYLSSFLGVDMDNYLDAREIMEIELVSNHEQELMELSSDIASGTIPTLEVQKKLNIPYGEASMITDVLNKLRGESHGR